MNDTMIEARSLFEIARTILRSSVWPRQASGTDPPGTAREQCSFYGYSMQHPDSCRRHFLVASGRDSVVSRLRAAMAEAAMKCRNSDWSAVPVAALERKLEETGR
jgi:hypothetical protein